MLTQRLMMFSPEEREENERYLDELIEIIKKNPHSCDEVWLPTPLGYPSIERHREIALYYAEIAEKFRAAGIRVSLQLWNTLGHGEETRNRDCSGLVYAHSNVENMRSHDGTISAYAFCWRGEHFTEYCKRAFAEYAAIHPYRVWFDDDLRAINHGVVARGCFCEHCLAAFNKSYSHAFTREELVHEINRGAIAVREEWIQFLRDGLYQFTYSIANAISERSPETSFGLQNGPNRRYTGYGYDHLFSAMRDTGGKRVGFRPGAGVYTDDNPAAFITKARMLEWMCATVPDYVDDIRPEIECVPDVAYGKSVQGITLESDLYFAYGAVSMSYAMMNRVLEPLSYHAREFAQFSAHAGYWKHLSALNARTTMSGVEIAVSPYSYLRPLDTAEADFRYEMEYIDAGFSPLLGIPLAFSSGDREKVYCLAEPHAKGLTDKDISFLLAHNVLADGESIRHLMARGYDCFGVNAFEASAILLDELYEEHAVNRGLYAPRWGKLAAAYPCTAFLPKSEDVSVISRYDRANETVSSLFENSRYPFGIAAFTVTTPQGGRWAVFGNRPWGSIQSFSRRNQFINAIDFLSGGMSLKAILDSPLKAVVLPRINAENKLCAVSLLNATPGESGTLELRVREPEGTDFCFESGEVTQKALPFTKTPEKEEYRVSLPSLPGWHVGTLFCRAKPHPAGKQTVD